MKELKKRNELVVKSNDVIEASYSLTLQEQRIILYLASKIKKTDEDFKPVSIKVKDFFNLIGVNVDSNYTAIISVCEKLRKRTLKIRKENSTLVTGWLSSVEVFYKKGYVELEFSPKLKPYLLQLKERFTKYKLQNVITLRHSYSIRLYELLKQYESIGYRYFELTDLKEILGINKEKYKRYPDFKKCVITPVKKEFDKKYKNRELDLTFIFTEKKDVRKVIGLEFRLQKHRKTPTKNKSNSIASDRLIQESNRCFVKNKGSCGARWNKYKNNKNSPCFHCEKFIKLREI